MSDERIELEKISPVAEAPIMRPGYPPTGVYPEATSYGYGYGYGNVDDDERVYLHRAWRAIRKRKLLILIIAIIVTSVVTVEMFRSKSIYMAATTVDIGKENRMTVRSGDVLIQTDESDDMYYVASIMKTKIRLIQSRPLLEDVVANLKLDQNPNFLDVTSKRSIVDAVRTLGDNFRSQKQAASPGVPPATTVAKSDGETERSREEKAQLAPYVDVLASYLSAEPLPDTRMLVISFTHTDPTLAAEIADNVAQVFIQRSFESKTEKFTNASEWLDRSTRELKAKAERAEQALANYSRDNNIFSSDDKNSLAIDKLSRLYDQTTRASTERMLKESLYQEVKAGRVAQLPEAFSDAKIAELQRRLGELTTSYAQLDVTYGPKNPKVVEVKQQMTAIQQQIDESRTSLEEKLRADYERSVRDEASLKTALEQAKTEASRQNQASIQYNILKQEVDTNTALYKDFLVKTSQSKIQKAEQHSNMRIIDPSQVPVSPVGPNRMRTIMIGFFISLVAGVGLAFMLEYLDNTVKTVEDVTRYTQLPALSVIPAISGRKHRMLSGNNGKKKTVSGLSLSEGGKMRTEQLISLDSRSSVAEAYRVLRTSVLLSSVDNPPKKILITSGQPGEGKTTTVVNTAISLAQLGSSVLIIDCDLRKPSVHKVLGVDQSRGLSTYLSTKIDLVDVMQKMPIPNLWVLPCGPIPPNPSEMISSAKMKDMLRLLTESFDHIIIDSPPLLKVTDPVILSTLVDGVVLVVHGGKSTRDVVRRTRQELAMAGAKIFGVVLNNVDISAEGYDSYSDYEQEIVGEEGNRK